MLDIDAFVYSIVLANIVTELGFAIDGILFSLTPLVATLLTTLDALVFTTLIGVLGIL